MDFYEFRTLVAEMRTNQKSYFKSRDKYYLIESKKYEKLVDQELEIENLIFKKKENEIIQGNLFVK